MANEKRLISYDVLIAHLDSCIEQGKGLFKSVCVAIKCFVEHMPTVDAVEVVHAEWVDAYGIRNSKCTNCGVAFCRVMNGDCYYCPNCGAKMDGDWNA